MEQEYEKDYSLLRPFDLEAAKRGEAIIDTDGDECNYIAGPHKETAEIVVEFPCDLGFMTCMAQNLRMAPLAWVEGKPVYKGDGLFHDCGPCVVIGGPIREDHDLRIKVDRMGFESDAQIPYLTWTHPKVKREIKLLAHLDADQLFWLREGAQPKWPAVRVPSEDKTVEVEEPADQGGGAK